MMLYVSVVDIPRYWVRGHHCRKSLNLFYCIQ